MGIIKLLNEKREEYYLDRAAQFESDLDIEKVFEYYDKAIKSNPDSYYAFLFRGILKMSFDDENGALLDFSRAIEINSNTVYAYLNRARLRYNTNDLSGALEDISVAINIEPENGSAYYQRGEIYQKMGNQGRAEMDFQIAKKKQSD